MDKKSEQLGMSPGTATHRLVRDILFSLVKDTPCFHCGKPLERNNFSIEHKTPWLDSEDPVKLFFDLENISYSHQVCNFGAARKQRAPCGTTSKYNHAGCRCVDCTAANAAKQRRSYTPEKRRTRYLTKGI